MTMTMVNDDEMLKFRNGDTFVKNEFKSHFTHFRSFRLSMLLWVSKKEAFALLINPEGTTSDTRIESISTDGLELLSCHFLGIFLFLSLNICISFKIRLLILGDKDATGTLGFGVIYHFNERQSE
eukprot:GILI01044166.1.p2 GENE.GILI01044166.1~~GILI01044166.1.p2  ORF type:complete len:125 (+),score=9.23 GILI01044166.1:199-573(+)